MKKGTNRKGAFPCTKVPNYSLLLTEKEAARFLNLGRSTMARYRSQGIGPCYHKLGRAVRYHIDDLIEYLKSRKIKTD